MAKRRNKNAERDIARGRIAVLLSQASGRPSFADRYARIARRIAMKYQMRLEPSWKAQMCRACGAYNATTRRVRVQRGRLVTTCLTCGDIHRRPLDSHGQQNQA